MELVIYKYYRPLRLHTAYKDKQSLIYFGKTANGYVYLGHNNKTKYPLNSLHSDLPFDSDDPNPISEDYLNYLGVYALDSEEEKIEHLARIHIFIQNIKATKTKLQNTINRYTKFQQQALERINKLYPDAHITLDNFFNWFHDTYLKLYPYAKVWHLIKGGADLTANDSCILYYMRSAYKHSIKQIKHPLSNITLEGFSVDFQQKKVTVYNNQNEFWFYFHKDNPTRIKEMGFSRLTKLGNNFFPTELDAWVYVYMYSFKRIKALNQRIENLEQLSQEYEAAINNAASDIAAKAKWISQQPLWRLLRWYAIPRKYFNTLAKALDKLNDDIDYDDFEVSIIYDYFDDEPSDIIQYLLREKEDESNS